MLCKKCKKELQGDWLYCPWCGSGAKKDPKKKMYQRADGLYEKKLILNGKRTIFRGKTEREVMQKIAAYTGELENAKTKPFKVYAEELERSWDSLSRNTVHGYKAPLADCVNKFGDTPVGDITPAMVKSFLDGLGKTRARKTVAARRQMISQVMALAVVAGDITFNPAEAKYKTAGKASEERPEASQKDMQIITEYWDEDLYSKLGFLIKCTGLRMGEALGLQYRDIDNNRKIITVSRSVYYEGNSPHTKGPKTKAGNRMVVMVNELVGRFNGPGDDYVFSLDGKALLRKHEVEKGWQAFCVRHGMAEPRVGHGYVKCSTTFHQLRHSFATTCKEKGVDPKVVQEMMGHSSYIVTDGYTHIRESMLNNAREKLDGAEKAQ